MKLLLQKFFIIFFLISPASGNCGNVSICSWNLKDLGNSKSDAEIRYISGILKNYDINAIQEVVAISGGTQAVARLVDALNRSGSSWDYCISAPTSSSAYKAERYAFIWNKSKVSKVGDAWLEKKYNLEIDREPYFATFKKEGKIFTLVNFHAKTKSMQPETEVKYFKFLPAEYPSLNLIFCGDFNLPESHSVFNPLKAIGYSSLLQGQKTTLRDRCLSDGCLASEFDNIFYKGTFIKVLNKGVIHFYKDFPDLEAAKLISDHVPIYCIFQI
jgi:endonuclease/exonuclease/phosphatase family metal-dependent hydrolase